MIVFPIGGPNIERGVASEQPDCRPHAGNDYLAPFGSMPPPHPPAQSGLRIGTVDLALHETTLSRVLSGRAFYGYAASTDEDRGQATTSLNWTIDGKLQLLNGKGGIRRITRRARWHVRDSESLDGRVFSLRVPSPGLYRFVLEFRNSDGLLKRFSQYIRGVNRHPGAALFMNRQSYHPGETAVFQLANPGTETIKFGEGGTLSSLGESGWTPVLRLPSNGKKKAFGLNPGQRGRCESFVLPSSLAPGEYRIEKAVDFLFPGGGSTTVVREFQLLE